MSRGSREGPQVPRDARRHTLAGWLAEYMGRVLSLRWAAREEQASSGDRVPYAARIARASASEGTFGRGACPYFRPGQRNRLTMIVAAAARCPRPGVQRLMLQTRGRALGAGRRMAINALEQGSELSVAMVDNFAFAGLEPQWARLLGSGKARIDALHSISTDLLGACRRRLWDGAGLR
jgi:hypothetical protein